MTGRHILFLLRPPLTLVLAVLVWPSAALGWAWPVEGPLLDGFRYEGDPYAGGQHRGVDVAAAPGAAVVAPAAGRVSFAGTVPAHGRTITIVTLDGYAVTLVHLGSIGVARGQEVAEGDSVGSVGPSGEPEHAGPYVHLGVRIAAREDAYVDPLSLLPARPGGAAPAAPVEAADGVAPIEDPAPASAPAQSASAPAPASVPQAAAPDGGAAVAAAGVPLAGVEPPPAEALPVPVIGPSVAATALEPAQPVVGVVSGESRRAGEAPGGERRDRGDAGDVRAAGGAQVRSGTVPPARDATEGRARGEGGTGTAPGAPAGSSRAERGEARVGRPEVVTAARASSHGGGRRRLAAALGALLLGCLLVGRRRRPVATSPTPAGPADPGPAARPDHGADEREPVWAKPCSARSRAAAGRGVPGRCTPAVRREGLLMMGLDDLLRDDTDLLRQLDAPHRARVHDDRRRRARAAPPPAR